MPSICLLRFSSLSLPDICSWFAAQLMLSRLACRAISFAPTRLFGGDFDMMPDPAGEWNPSPSDPRPFLLGCFRWRWRCWKLWRLFAAGEPGIQGALGTGALLDMESLDTWGVVI